MLVTVVLTLLVSSVLPIPAVVPRAEAQTPFTPTARMVAGLGSTAGYVNGPINDVKFSSPFDIVADPGGRYLYVSDTGNDAIRMIDLLTGRTQTLVSGGVIERPTYLSLGPDGSLYVVVDPRTPQSPPGCQDPYTPGVHSGIRCGQFYLEPVAPAKCGCWHDEGSGDEKIVRIPAGNRGSAPTPEVVAEWDLFAPRGVAVDPDGKLWVWDMELKDPGLCGGCRSPHPRVSSIVGGVLTPLMPTNAWADLQGGDLQYRLGSGELWAQTNMGTDGYYTFDKGTNALVLQLDSEPLAGGTMSFSSDGDAIIWGSGKDIRRLDIGTDTPSIVYNANIWAGFSSVAQPKWALGKLMYAVNRSQHRVEAIDISPDAQLVERLFASLGGQAGSTLGLAEDPVNTATGNLTEKVTDLPAPPGVFGMELSRTYNSLGATTGSLGDDWTLSTDVRAEPFGSNDPDNSDVNVWTGDGRTLRFANTATGIWTAVPGVVGSLVWDTDHYELHLLSGESIVFDPDGRIASRSDGRGQSVTFTWDGNGAPMEMVHSRAGLPSGHQIAFTDSDSDGLVDQATASDGRVVDYTYDSVWNRLETASDPHFGNETGYGIHRYDLDDAGRIATISIEEAGNPSNNRVRLGVAYDEFGRVESQVNESGDDLTFTYDPSTGITTLTNAASGDVTRYHHDGLGRLIGITDTNNKPISKDWDSRDQLQNFGDRRGAEFGFAYDSEGRLVQRVTPDPTTGALPSRTAGPGSLFPSPGPSDGWSVESYTYVAPGDPRVLEYTNGEGEVTRFGYDSAERTPSSVTVGYGTAHAIETTFDVVDELVQWSQDADGVRTCFDYDLAGRLVEKSVGCNTATPLITTYHYNARGLLESRIDPEHQSSGLSWSYEYDGMGRIIREQKPDNTTVLYSYDPVTGDTTVTDELNHETVIEVEHGATTGCGTAGTPCRIETTTAPGGGPVPQISKAVFDRSGDLVESRTSPDGGTTWHTTTNSYGPLGRLLSTTDPTGVVTSFGYDDNGNLTHTARGTNAFDPSQGSRTVYDKLGRVIEQIQAPDDNGSVVTTTDYDRAGRPILEVTAEGSGVERSVRTEYLPNGLTKLTALARPDLGVGVEATTEYTYTPAGRTSCVKTLMDHATATYSYTATDRDDLGRQARSRTNLHPVTGCADDPNNTGRWAISTTGYDGGGRLAWSQTPTQYATAPGHSAFNSNYVTTFGYDNMGRLTTVTAPDPSNPGSGTVTSRACYTNRGELARSMDPAGNVTAYRYYPSGALRDVIDPRGMPANPSDPCAAVPTSGTVGTTGYVYDGEDSRTLRVSFDHNGTPMLETWTYDAAGRETSYQDALGKVTETAYWIGGSMLVAQVKTTGSTSDAADPTGSSKRSRLTLNYPSGRVGITVDVRLNTTNSQTDRYTTTYSYDEAGNRVSAHGVLTDASSAVVSEDTVGFGYDRGGSVTSVMYPSSLQASYVWDVGGRQTEATMPNGAKYRYAYGVDRLVDDVDLYAGDHSSVWLPLANYTYDANGHQTSEVILGGLGGGRTWAFDPATGQLDHLAQALLDPNGVHSGLDSYWETTWNVTGRLATDCLATSGSSCDTGSGDRGVAYSYDRAGQLTEAQVTNPHPTDPDRWAYTYGNRGERLTQTVQDGASAVTTSYTYDAALQLLSADPDNTDPTTTYTWDKAGRRRTRTRGSVTATYDYDARGMLTNDNGTSRRYDPLGYLTDFVYYDYSGRDPYPRLAMVGDQNGSFRFDWGAHSVIGLGVSDDTPTIVVYGEDPLGSVAESVSAADATRGLYDPYGNRTDNAAEFGYRGELTVGTTDFVYMRARWYDPSTGSFISRDPLPGVNGTATVTNPYHYADNDPLNKTDPLGLRPDEGPCSVFNGTEIVLDTQTCENALDLWEHRDRSGPDCAAVGGVTYGSGTCWVPPQSGQQKDFCFPPTSADGSVVSLGPNGQCGVWSVEIGCERFSNTVTDWICQHRVGILKVSGYALIPAAIGVGAVTGGAGAGAVLAVTSATLQVSAEAFDDSPCKSARITVTVVLTILGGGVGGAFSEGGLVAGEAVTEAGLAGLDQVEFTC